MDADFAPFAPPALMTAVGLWKRSAVAGDTRLMRAIIFLDVRESDSGRRVKVYALTNAGRKQLHTDEAAWQHATRIVERFFTIQEDPS